MVEVRSFNKLGVANVDGRVRKIRRIMSRAQKNEAAETYEQRENGRARERQLERAEWCGVDVVVCGG